MILATDKGFGNKKTGHLFKNLQLSGDVEVTGIEPVAPFFPAIEYADLRSIVDSPFRSGK